MAHLPAESGRSFGKLGLVINGYGSTARLVSDVAQPFLAELFFEGFEEKCIEQADRIDLRIVLLNQAPYLSQRIAACVVASVGEDNNCFALVVRGTHFGCCQIDSVQHRGRSARLYRDQLLLQFINRPSRSSEKMRAIREANSKILVFWICVLEKLHERCSLHGDLVAHALTHIEEHRDRDGSLLAHEIPDFLSLIFLIKRKVLLAQADNWTIHGVSNYHRYQNQIHVNVDGLYAPVPCRWIVPWRVNRGRRVWRRTSSRHDVHIVG